MKILVGYIDTPQGAAALDRAVEECKLRSGHLTVVHSMRGDENADEFRAATQRFEGLEQRLSTSGIPYELRQLARGVPAGEDLVELANEDGVDLIVIGIRRRSPVGKLVLGSNAQHVVLNANCAVLAVKADDAEV